MLIFNTSFLYTKRVFIIAFGPNDGDLKQNDVRCSTEEGWSER